MPNLLLFGEIGNGKSTTANRIMKILSPDGKIKESDAFESGKS